MLRGPSLVGGIVQTDEYSPWIHHCVHVEGSVLGGWYFTDRWVRSLDPPLCSCWGVRPWWVVFYRQMSMLPGSTTVFMLRGPSLVGGILQTDEYSPWIHHCVHVEGSVLGGWYFTDRWVLSLDPPLCSCWGVRPWWVVYLETDEYAPWIHHCVHVEGSVLGGWYFTDRWVLSLDPPLCLYWGVRPWLVVLYKSHALKLFVAIKAERSVPCRLRLNRSPSCGGRRGWITDWFQILLLQALWLPNR